MKKISALIIIAIVIMLFSVVGMATLNAYASEIEPYSPKTYLAEISYNYFIYLSGKVVVSIHVWVDTDALTKDMDTEESDAVNDKVLACYQEIKAVFNLNGYEAEIKEGYLEVIIGSYSGLTEMYIENDRNGYEKGGGYDYKMGFLFNEISYKQTPFSNLNPNSYIMVSRDIILTIDGIATGDISYIYNYGTRYKESMLYTDADKFYDYDNIKIHSFIMDETNLDREINITQKTPNSLVWYGFVILGACIFTVVVVILIKKKKI